MKWILVGLIFLTVLSACNKETEIPELPYSFFNEPVTITGYHAVDLNGSAIFTVGIPNTFREIEVMNITYAMRTFPNPSRIYSEEEARVTWNVGLSQVFQGKRARYWLVKALSDNQNHPSIFENGDLVQVIPEPLILQQGNTEGARLIGITQDAEIGENFRLYIELDDIMLYDNLVSRDDVNF